MKKPHTTNENEPELVNYYLATGCRDTLNDILIGRSAWVMRIIKSLPLRPFTDRDACYADAMSEIALSVHRFDSTRNFSSFLSKIVARASFAAQRRQNVEQCQDFNYEGIIDETPGSASDVLSSIYEVVDAIPDSELNEDTRMIIHRMLAGYTVEEIAGIIGRTIPRTRRAVENARCFIAHNMLKAGKSAAPWIDDRDLQEMSRKYEASVRLTLDLE